MRLRPTLILWSTMAVAGLAMAACGGDKHDKPVASAEPRHAAAPPPKPPAAPPPPTAPPAAQPPPPDAPPDDSGHAGHHGRGEHGPKGPHGDGEHAKAGEHDKAQKVIHLGHARMEFNHPGNGWTEKKKGPWTLFHPGDKTSVLAFVEFESPGEATSRIGQIAAHLELTDINWRGSGEDKAIGPQRLKAHFAEGSCRVASNKHACEIEYYTVEGALLIVYAFETDVKKVEKKERMATRSVESLRRF
jgi:hypothetical protein